MSPGSSAPQRLETLGDVEPLWPVVGCFLKLGRNATFEAARRGEIPTLRFGKRLLVSKVALQRLLELGQHSPTEPTSGAPIPLPASRKVAANGGR
jgi:hypothetical protein